MKDVMSRETNMLHSEMLDAKRFASVLADVRRRLLEAEGELAFERTQREELAQLVDAEVGGTRPFSPSMVRALGGARDVLFSAYLAPIRSRPHTLTAHWAVLVTRYLGQCLAPHRAVHLSSAVYGA